MSECKHDGNWRLQGAGGLNMDVVCEECGAKIRDVLESQECQLEVAADEWAENVTCDNCPCEEICGVDANMPCDIKMRKRWKEIASIGDEEQP